MDKWKKAQQYEIDWHRNQQFNSYNEETKQYIYAEKMGLDEFKTNFYNMVGWDLGDKKVLDVGGSGQSILLKMKAKERTVIDPIKPSKWMLKRYREAGIKFIKQKGENKIKGKYDIVIGMNVLQHCENPAKIIKNIISVSKVVKWFDWIEAGLSEGHINNLTEKDLNKWFGGVGKVERINQFPACGLVWYGTFKGKLYDSKMPKLRERI